MQRILVLIDYNSDGVLTYANVINRASGIGDDFVVQSFKVLGDPFDAPRNYAVSMDIFLRGHAPDILAAATGIDPHSAWLLGFLSHFCFITDAQFLRLSLKRDHPDMEEEEFVLTALESLFQINRRKP